MFKFLTEIAQAFVIATLFLGLCSTTTWLNMSARKRKKKLYSGTNAPLMYSVLDATLRKAMTDQDRAWDALKVILSESNTLDVLKRLKDK